AFGQRRSAIAEAPPRRASDGKSRRLRYPLAFHLRLAHDTHRGKPSGGYMMDTQVSSAPTGDGSATARPRTKPADRPSTASQGDGSSTIDVPAIEGPVWVAWREGTLTRAKELEALPLWMRPRDDQENDEVLAAAIDRHLKAARQAAKVVKLDPHRRFRIFRNGPLIERARSNLDAAEAHLLSIAPDSYILGQMPCLLNHVQCHLPPKDPRRQEFERSALKLGIKDRDHPLAQKDKNSSPAAKEGIVENERRKIVNIVRAASSAALREHVRLRSFRNVVVVTATLMLLLAVGVAITGLLHPTLIPMCFAPEEAGQVTVVCPT